MRLLLGWYKFMERAGRAIGWRSFETYGIEGQKVLASRAAPPRRRKSPPRRR